MSVIDIGFEKVWVQGNDSIVIRHYGDGKKGGVLLDVDDFTEKVIPAGHIIVYDTENEVYKPLGVTDGAFDALADGYEYAGICATSVSAKAPLVGVMTDGEVNDEALPFTFSDEQKAAFKTAVPTIRFDHD